MLKIFKRGKRRKNHAAEGPSCRSPGYRGRRAWGGMETPGTYVHGVGLGACACFGGGVVQSFLELVKTAQMVLATGSNCLSASHPNGPRDDTAGPAAPAALAITTARPALCAPDCAPHGPLRLPGIVGSSPRGVHSIRSGAIFAICLPAPTLRRCGRHRAFAIRYTGGTLKMYCCRCQARGRAEVGGGGSQSFVGQGRGSKRKGRGACLCVIVLERE